jgi:transposase
LQKAAAPIFEPEAELLKPLYRRSIIETQSQTTSGRSSVVEQTLPKLQIQLRRGAPEALHRLAVARRKGNAPQFGLRAELFRMTGTDLTQIDGVDVMTGTTILSEAGWDMSKWKTEDHFVCWLRLCPDNRISGDKIIGKARLPTNGRISIALKSQHCAEGQRFLFSRPWPPRNLRWPYRNQQEISGLRNLRRSTAI